ncbi:MAG TPA: penicillin-binding protein 2 [Actinospica sp.]|jgi:cell division protein FtsI (penicillin-binding protein 3)|nr:penicillin-binding protein 2 [Actinospica sp.]
MTTQPPRPATSPKTPRGPRKALRAEPPPPAKPAAPLRLGRPRRRLSVGMLALAFVFSLYGGRLVQLQVADSGGYAARAAADRTADVTLYATRGSILDASGQPLAESVDAVDVIADPLVIAQQKQDPAVYASKLAAYLGNPAGTADVAALRTKLAESASQYQVLATQITPAVWKQIKALGLTGITGNQDPKVVYPQGAVAANAVGFVDSHGVGSAGLEREYNSRLSGTDGKISYQAAYGYEIPTTGINEQAAVDGTSVETTIDSKIQWAAQQAIDAQVSSTKAALGTVVVMDPRTGAILALATSQTYDPNNPSAATSEQLGDDAISDVFEPGSVAKVVTMSAEIQQGVTSPSTKVVVPATLNTGDGYVVHDDTDHGTEHLTLNGILAESSNIGTDLTSLQLAPNNMAERNAILYDYFSAFGLGHSSGLGLPGESPGILAPAADWNHSQQYTVAFGQGLSVNAVQATSVYATIANEGVRVTPNIVKGYVDGSGKFTAAAAPTRTQVVSPKTAEQVSEMMESVVSDQGTGTDAEIPGYRVAGKTGTANRYVASCGGYCGYTASFIGYAPADNPQLVMGVFVEGPQGSNHFGGSVSAPVFQKVMSFALQEQGVPPTGTNSPKLPVTW